MAVAAAAGIVGKVAKGAVGGAAGKKGGGGGGKKSGGGGGPMQLLSKLINTVKGGGCANC